LSSQSEETKTSEPGILLDFAHKFSVVP